MILEALVHGLVLAFGLIMPLGVQNLFIFTQGASQPKLSRVMPIVVTAGLSDTALILLAVLGVSLVVMTVSWLKSVLVVAGVAFLAWFGLVMWRSQNTDNQGVDASIWSLKRRVVFTLSVSWLNPHAILDTIGVIGTSSLSYIGNAKLVFTATCIAVSWMWFTILALAGRVLGKVDDTGRLRVIINKISAVIMWASALYLVWSIGV